MKYINIMPKAAEERWWSIASSRSYLTNHKHRNSPFESDDDCGTCDGASCDGCRRVAVEAHWGFSVYSDTLSEWLLEQGVPRDVAESLTYDDRVGLQYQGYRLVWPSADMLREQYPEVYRVLTTPDPEVLEVIESFRGRFQVFGDLQDAVLVHYGLSTWESHHHVAKQLSLYWHNAGRNHKVAC